MSKRNGEKTQRGSKDAPRNEKGNGAVTPESIALKLGVPRDSIALDAQLAAISVDAISKAVDYKIAAQVINAASARIRLAVAIAKYGGTSGSPDRGLLNA